MTTYGLYISLRQYFSEEIGSAFDRHVIACIFSIAASESSATGSLAVSLGMSGAELREAINYFFPDAISLLETHGLDAEVKLEEDELCLRELLKRNRTYKNKFSEILVALMARRASRTNHLWQDLGLENRGELGALMKTHFGSLARRNRNDMKWKKFFFRMICSDANFSLCTAPSCKECNDFDNCFGDESGESLFARTLNGPQMLMQLPVLA